MMGIKRRAFAPVVGFSLDELVPADDFYRRLESALDLSFVREMVSSCYAERGRPSIDPVVFFKLQLVMFFEDIRSERQLLRIAADRLSVRRFLGYDLGEALPDHSSLTRIRDRIGLDGFRRFFDAIVGQCVAAGIVQGRELFFDGTEVVANAAADSVVPRAAVEAHLAARFADMPSPEQATDGEEPATLPLVPDRALTAANGCRHDWYAEAGRQRRDVRHGRYRRVADRKASTTDPDASLLPTPGRRLARLGYRAHYVVDGGKARIILAALVTPAEVMENQPMLDLLWHSRFRWHVRPHHVTGDTTYGTLENVAGIEDAGIRAYLPIRDANKREPLFGQEKFTYDAQADLYRCPRGVALTRVTYSYSERTTRYQAPAAACNACPLKAQCTTGKSGRHLQRSFDAAYFERVRTYYGTAGYERALRKRKVWMEPLFAEAKLWHRLRRFRLRGLRKVNCEALVVASGQNVKRLLKHGRAGWRPWPDGGATPLVVAIIVRGRSLHGPTEGAVRTRTRARQRARSGRTTTRRHISTATTPISRTSPPHPSGAGTVCEGGLGGLTKVV